MHAFFTRLLKSIKALSFIILAFASLACSSDSTAPNHTLVFQSDFGLKDGAVSAMKGVASGVSKDLLIFDVTHEIPAYNVWEAAYRLVQTAPYWPVGTVFVSVVDPGVGTNRKSVVLLTKSGHYFITPDNGTLTLVAEQMGIQEIREIDEAVNRRQNSNESYTFHGRDVYAYTGARLASRTISFKEVGPTLPNKVVSIPYQKARFENRKVLGAIPILDVQYGNVWTNIDKKVFEKLGVRIGEDINVQVLKGDSSVFQGKVRYVNTFGEVPEGEMVGYFNSLLQFSLGINMGDFAKENGVSSGNDWRVILTP
jgi:S-adenosylmethionine hydrolase